MATKHAKQFAGSVADDADPNTVSPSDWDAEHVGGGPNSLVIVPGVSASAAATNNLAATYTAVGDPALRVMADMRGVSTVRIQFRLGGTIVAATKIRVQYHASGNIAVATGDAGWVNFHTSAGSHVANAWVYTADIPLPTAAQINHLQWRAGIFDGDGAADPTIAGLILNCW